MKNLIRENIKTKGSMLIFRYSILTLMILSTFTVLAHYVYACSVPVFRYALERWKPDTYKGIYIYRGELSEQDQKLIDQLNKASSVEAALNLIIRPVNLDTFSKDKLKDLLKGPIPDKLPLLALWYPGQMNKTPPFLKEIPSPSFVKELIGSPKRKQIAESLLNSDSVVWVFIPSGNKKKDESALSLIRQELDLALKKFEKNPYTVMDGSERKRLSYGFPVMILSRDDSTERVLVETLMKSEPDLYKHTDEPLLFPVFGRGRSLGCLYGESITKKNLNDAVTFLSGACSCEVKNLNPGTDLLMAAPWDIVVLNSFINEGALPELTGVMPETAEPAPDKEEPPLKEKEVNPADNISVYAVYTTALAGVILVVIILSIVISRRRKE